MACGVVFLLCVILVLWKLCQVALFLQAALFEEV